MHRVQDPVLVSWDTFGGILFSGLGSIHWLRGCIHARVPMMPGAEGCMPGNGSFPEHSLTAPSTTKWQTELKGKFCSDPAKQVSGTLTLIYAFHPNTIV